MKREPIFLFHPELAAEGTRIWILQNMALLDTVERFWRDLNVYFSNSSLCSVSAAGNRSSQNDQARWGL